MTAPDDKVLTERRDAHLWVTINRGEKANALTVDLMERITELRDILEIESTDLP